MHHIFQAVTMQLFLSKNAAAFSKTVNSILDFISKSTVSSVIVFRHKLLKNKKEKKNKK